MSRRSMMVTLLAVAWTTVAHAEDRAAGELVNLARQAAAAFAAPTSERLTQSRASVRLAASLVAQRLAHEGENGEAWRRYLLLDEIERQLESSAAPDESLLRQSKERLAQNHPGLDIPVLVDLRSSLDRYLTLLAAARPETRDEYAARMTELTAMLVAARDGATPELLSGIGEQVGWLERHGQADELVAATHRRYAPPNLLLTVSQRVLDGFVQPFRDNTPFQERILDTPTYGQGLIEGSVRLHFAPSENGAAVDLLLHAAGDADTVSVRGPVRVYSLGHVRLNGRKRILFTPQGVVPAGTQVEADGEGETQSVDSTLRGLANRIACRIAWRALDANAAAAQNEANRLAERRLRGRFDEAADGRIAKLDRLYREQLLHPLVTLRQTPRHVRVYSTAERMLLEVVYADRDQLTAASPPPELAGAADVAVRLHESSINNTASKLLAGKTIGGGRLLAEIQTLLGAVEAPVIETTGDEVEITLADIHPVTLRLDDDVAAFTIRGQSIVAKGKSYPAMNVTVRYRVEMGSLGARLALVDEPEIVPERLAGASGRMSFAELAVRRILMNRLERDLEREFFASAVELPDNAFHLGPLPIEQFAADDGWLAFSCRVQHSNETAKSQAQAAEEQTR